MPEMIIKNQSYQPELVIFDKDGTLLDFKKTWIGIIDELIQAIGRYTPVNDELSQMLQKVFGIDIPTKQVDPFGPLAMATDQETNALLIGALYFSGLRWDDATRIIKRAGQEVFSGHIREKNLTAADGALQLLKSLQEKGIKCALATNDNIADATNDMRIIGALPYLDLVMGADGVQNAKPEPDMIHKICQDLGIAEAQSMMVGDAITDTLAGQNAGVMLSIGIANPMPAELMREHADVVVDSLLELI